MFGLTLKHIFAVSLSFVAILFGFFIPQVRNGAIAINKITGAIIGAKVALEGVTEFLLKEEKWLELK